MQEDLGKLLMEEHSMYGISKVQGRDLSAVDIAQRGSLDDLEELPGTPYGRPNHAVQLYTSTW